MKQFLIRASIMMGLISLTACTSMNSSLDCPNRAGTNCKSLDQINAMVDGGSSSSTGSQTNQIANINDAAQFQSFPSLASYYPGAPLRYGETVQRIWVAPYEDTAGNYHQDSMMYVIMQRGHWIGNPVNAIQS